MGTRSENLHTSRILCGTYPMPGKVFAHDAVGTVAAAFLWKGIKLEGEFPSVPVRMNHVIIMVSKWS